MHMKFYMEQMGAEGYRICVARHRSAYVGMLLFISVSVIMDNPTVGWYGLVLTLFCNSALIKLSAQG